MSLYMKDIDGYEGRYAVTKDGRIWSHPKPCSSKNGKWMKQRLNTNRSARIIPRSCYSVGLYKDSKRKSFLVHRLVAQAYILNLEDKPDINHKDGNPLNNNVENLEWCTKSENMQHAIKNGLVNNFTEKQKRARSENGRKTIAKNSLKRKIYATA